MKYTKYLTLISIILLINSNSTSAFIETGSPINDGVYGCYHNNEESYYAIVGFGEQCPIVPVLREKNYDPLDHTCNVTIEPLGF